MIKCVYTVEETSEAAEKQPSSAPESAKIGIKDMHNPFNVFEKCQVIFYLSEADIAATISPQLGTPYTEEKLHRVLREAIGHKYPRLKDAVFLYITFNDAEKRIEIHAYHYLVPEHNLGKAPAYINIAKGDDAKMS